MQSYDNETDQLEAIRSFFRENGRAIVFGIVLGSGGLFGWNYWQTYQENSATESAIGFYQISQQLAADKTDALAKAEHFISVNNNAYGVFAALEVAQKLVKNADYQNAQRQLEAGLAQTNDSNLQSLISLRIARLQMQQQQLDAALQTLSKVSDAGWLAQMQEIRGDILVAKGDLAEARAAYTEGMRLNPSRADQSLLRIKLNNISA